MHWRNSREATAPPIGAMSYVRSRQRPRPRRIRLDTPTIAALLVAGGMLLGLFYALR